MLSIFDKRYIDKLWEPALEQAKITLGLTKPPEEEFEAEESHYSR